MHLLLICSLIFVCIFIESFKSDEICKEKLNKNRFYKVFWLGMLLFLFAALRDTTVGIDIPGYADNYQALVRYDFKEILTLKEGRDPIFSIFCKLLTYISPSPNFMLAVVGAIVAFSFSYYVYHQKSDVLLAYIFFVTFRLYAFTLTGLRQAIALSICWIAFVMMQKGKNVGFFLLTILASLFHASAIVFVISWLLYKFGKPMSIFCGCFIVTAVDLFTNHAVISVFSRLMTENRFENYLDIGEEAKYSGGGTFYLYMMFFVLIIFVMCMRHKGEIIKETDKLFNVVCAAMMLYVMCQSMPVFFRISYYFILPFYTLIPISIDKVFKKREALLTRIVIVFMLSAQYVILSPGAGINNYQFFWAT